MNPTTYKNPLEAQNALTSSFNPTNDAQRQAIANASALVPTITSSQLAPSTPITPVTTPPITPPPTVPLVADTKPAQAETGVLPEETAIYKMLQELQGQTNTLGSQDSFQTAQNQRFGVEEKQSLVNSLKNQNDALVRQADQTRIQLQQEMQNIQNRAQLGGANVTRGGLAPQERAATTQANQQLLSLAIQQSSIAAQHALASNDLASAISLADRAVKMEFQPKKDALDAQRANIELLLKDPTLTLAQQKRAEAVKLENDKKVKQLEIDQKDKETLQGLILQAQQNGAPSALTAQALKDGTVIGAGQILGAYTAKETDASIQRFNKAKQTGYKGSFTDFLAFEKQKATGGVSGAKGAFKNDLDALVANAKVLIPSKFGQENFDATISRARDDADKLKIVATAVLSNAPGEVKNDFIKQAQGVANVDKALALLRDGAKTGLLQSGKQYTYNLAGNDFDPNLAKLNAYITAAIQPYRSSVTGAAWGEQEDQEYQNLFGSIKYTPEALKTRLETLKDILLGKSSGAIYTYASPLASISGEANPFNTSGIPAPDGSGDTIIITD